MHFCFFLNHHTLIVSVNRKWKSFVVYMYDIFKSYIRIWKQEFSDSDEYLNEAPFNLFCVCFFFSFFSFIFTFFYFLPKPYFFSYQLQCYFCFVSVLSTDFSFISFYILWTFLQTIFSFFLFHFLPLRYFFFVLFRKPERNSYIFHE